MPRSLLSQMLLLMGAALLVAQLVNLTFILNEQQKLALAQNEGPALFRFAQVASSHRVEVPRRGPYDVAAASVVDTSGLPRRPELESRLRGALDELQVPYRDVRAAARAEFGLMPPHGEARRRGLGDDVHDYRKVVYLSLQRPDGRWLNGRLPVPRGDPWLLHQILLATAILFLLVFGVVIFIARRLARPLRDLTAAAEAFEGRAEPPPVEPRGPSDVRRAIEAFNAMNRRTLALLDEKDRMLGAIGHDLRTPLASLRIRAEAMEPEEERERLIATVEEMHATLEDILVLARTGRSREAPRAVDVAALADAVVEQYREGDSAVAFAPGARAVLEVQPNLLRRALRNLIDNALTYAGSATVRVEERPGTLALIVDDEGPGIPEARLREVLEPFQRLEGSRNRESGGAGLGLAIAQAVALAHGGRVVLANREGGGLSAALVLPRR